MANELNVFGSGPQGISAQSVTAAMATTRQAQEVQAAMVVAKNFPRNPRQSLDRILESCARPTLAENATYEYSRGGSKIYGPSIRLAECIAQSWGNIDFGFIELDRSKGESTVMAYAWDLETNTRQSRVFSVKHQRDTKNGSYALTEERDIYERIANDASRRVRACILALIPGDVIDAAMRQCDTTLKAQQNGMPIETLRESMIKAFEKYEVTPEMLAAFCQKKSAEYLDEADIRRLKRVYTSFQDGLVGVEVFIDRMNALAAENKTQKPAETAPAEQAPSKSPAPAEEEPPFEMSGLDDL